MRKKDSHGNPPSSKVTIPLTKLFVIHGAFKHFERDRIDSTAVANFNNLIHSISIKVLKNPTVPDVVELFKVASDLIIGFLANLEEETYRHTCTH